MTATRSLKGATIVAAAGVWLVAAAYLWRTRVPGNLALPHLDAAAIFSAAELRRADRYSTVASAISLGGVVVQVAILGVLVVFGRRIARGFALGEIGAGVMIAVAANLFVWIGALPLGLLGQWWDRRYGLSKSGYESFLGGAAVNLVVQTATVAVVLVAVMLVARRFQRRWWLIVAPLFVAVGAVLVVGSALLSASGAHRLRDPAIARLAAKEGVPGTDIRVDKVSDTTRAINAETTGVGPTTVVLLWDTLFHSGLSDQAVDFVAAHELGHAARRHILKGLAWGLLFSLPLTFLLAEATRRRGGIHRAEVVPFALLVSVVLGLLTTPLQNVVSRRYEAEADWMALQATHDPDAGREAFRSFTRVDLAEPSPPWWDYVLLENHPTVMQRIATTRAWTTSRAGSSRAGS
jgi:STE24 endopeptidase